MIKHKLSIIILLFGLSGCNFQKHYVNSDYSFYQDNFDPAASSMLRTDGVYVLKKIVTNEGERGADREKVYKFYASGQANLILDRDKKLNAADDFVRAFNQRVSANAEGKTSTLFEGYYKVDKDRIVIQQVSVPRKQFYYNYGFLKQDTLILVKETLSGGGKMKNEYFTDYYKAYYIFIPTKQDYIKPNW